MATVTKGWYNDLAKVYEARYGEPLVADAVWCEPLFETVELAVAASADLTFDEFCDGTEHDEVVERTAAVIACITHGVKAVVGAVNAEGGYTGVFVDGVKVAESRRVEM